MANRLSAKHLRSGPRHVLSWNTTQRAVGQTAARLEHGIETGKQKLEQAPSS
jgi:hypothetical protein